MKNKCAWLVGTGRAVLALAVFHSVLLGALGVFLIESGAPREGYGSKVLASGPYGAYGSYEWDLAIGFAPELTLYVIAAPDECFSPHGGWRVRQGRKIFAIESMKTVAEWLGI